MANIFDYIDWRGDLSFSQVPCCDIDNLILSRLSYMPFDDIVPAETSISIPLCKAAKLLLESNIPTNVIFCKSDLKLLSALISSDRFKNIELSNYINRIDLDLQKQFSAITLSICPDLYYISYRGTDNSIIGWKEDFNMSFTSVVPAQYDAVEYLEAAADRLHGQLILGGHSKGGNLAVYASVFCRPDIQSRIINVYNNDGPGFRQAVLNTKQYQSVSDKIRTFIPQSSVVGLLLEHEETYTIIHSTQVGLLQHDIYSWQVMRDHFLSIDEISNGSRFVNKTLKDWLENMDDFQRKQFIDTLFSVLQSTHAKTLDDLLQHWYSNTRAMIRCIRKLDPETQNTLSQAFRLLWISAKSNFSSFLPKLTSLRKK